MSRNFLVTTFAVLFLTLAYGQTTAQQTPDRQAAEEQIRSLNRQWVEAVKNKDAEAIADFYAEDGVLMPPNAPLAQGRETIRAAWEEMLGLPDFSLGIEPSTIEIAEAGDMAYEIGTYSMSFEPAEGGVEDLGKYVVVWTKEDAAWKAAADIFNSDLPIRQ